MENAFQEYAPEGNYNVRKLRGVFSVDLTKVTDKNALRDLCKQSNVRFLKVKMDANLMIPAWVTRLKIIQEEPINPVDEIHEAPKFARVQVPKTLEQYMVVNWVVDEYTFSETYPTSFINCALSCAFLAFLLKKNRTPFLLNCRPLLVEEFSSSDLFYSLVKILQARWLCDKLIAEETQYNTTLQFYSDYERNIYTTHLIRKREMIRILFYGQLYKNPFLLS